ncbi:MAG: EamA family transporter [Syntrophobacteraceae bacterium]|jgi:undecaprenyl phosphate-alpha-L-ara4N flippase subunit ArnE
MSLSQLSLIFLTVIALSAGQILFKMAAGSFEFSAAGLINGLLNTKLIIALVVYFFATLTWLFALKATPLRVAYPFGALAFFIVPVLAHFLLGESIKWNTFAGAALIAVGVWVSVYQ